MIVNMAEVANINLAHDPASSQLESPSTETSTSAAQSLSPSLERSASRSSLTSNSSVSTSGNQDGTSQKKRGYMRPQATVFADSARNRDSVMSLGSIAHLQYYFARTGLLDGKGAQLARDANLRKGDAEGNPLQGNEQSLVSDSLYLSELYPSSPPNLDYSDYDSSLVTSTDPSSVSGVFDENQMMTLPPTVSTYKHRQLYIPPPPNVTVLRRELKEALDDAKKVLVELYAGGQLPDTPQRIRPGSRSAPGTPAAVPEAVVVDAAQGWHEVQGLHVLDLVTLAIRAAKTYYTSHERPYKLYSIRSERDIRADLYAVLEVLKKVAARNFSGGYRRSEAGRITMWIESIEDLVAREEAAERIEEKRREEADWAKGDWTGRERQREWLFLKAFQAEAGTESCPIPEPSADPPAEEDTMPSEFCKYFQNGIELCRLHNSVLLESKRQFGKIKEFHLDTGKPYRSMENLRFWLKAAELRWDLFLKVDVESVVLAAAGNGLAWKTFDEAIMTWAKRVREEILVDWKEQRENLRFDPPKMAYESNESAN